MNSMTKIESPELRWVPLELLVGLTIATLIAFAVYEQSTLRGIYQQAEYDGLVNVLFACLWILMPIIHAVSRKIQRNPTQFHAIYLAYILAGAVISFLYGSVGAAVLLIVVEVFAVVFFLANKSPN